MIEFTFSRFQLNPFEKHIGKIEKVMDALDRLDSTGGIHLTDLTEDDKKNALVAIKYLETARDVLRRSNQKK